MKAIISTITGSTVSAFTILGMYLHVRAVKSGEQEAVNDTFRKGQKSLQSICQPVPRPAAEKFLWKTLVPQGPTINRYALVFGANGTGKTTTALKLAMDAKGGVVYVEVPPAGDKWSFGKALATAIGVRSKYETFSLNGMLSAIGVLSQLNTPADLVTDCLHLISNAAADYRNSTGRSPLLIIDNINQLLGKEDGIDLLILLQDYAKSSAVSFLKCHISSCAWFNSFCTSFSAGQKCVEVCLCFFRRRCCGPHEAAILRVTHGVGGDRRHS